MKSLDFLKEGFVEDASEAHQDHEVQMARQECFNTAENALALHKLLRNISEAQGLEGWVSSKITLANDYLKRVREYLEYEFLTKDINEITPQITIAENAESKKKLIEYKIVSGQEGKTQNYVITGLDTKTLDQLARAYYGAIKLEQDPKKPNVTTIIWDLPTAGPTPYGSYDAKSGTATFIKKMTDVGDQLAKSVKSVERSVEMEEGLDLDQQAMTVADRLTSRNNLKKLQAMRHDSTVYRALDRYFANNNIPENIYNRVANIVFKRINTQGVAEGKKDPDELSRYENDVKTLLANGDIKTAKKVAGLSPDAAHRNHLRNIIRHYDSKQGVADGSSFQTDQMVSHISQIIKGLEGGGDKNTYMKLVAREMPHIVQSNPKLFRRAFGIAYDRFFHIDQDDDFDYTDDSMRQGEKGIAKGMDVVSVKEQGVAEGFDQEAGIGIDGKSFKFKIRDLVAFAEKYPVTKVDPNQFADQIAGREEDPAQSMARAEKADLQYPIIVVKRKNGQLWIADGTHRAHKAILNKLPAIQAKIIPIKDMTPFAVKQAVAEGSEKIFTVVYYSKRTDRTVSKPIKASSESKLWDRLRAKDIDVISVEEQGVAEDWRQDNYKQRGINSIMDLVTPAIREKKSLDGWISGIYNYIEDHNMENDPRWIRAEKNAKSMKTKWFIDNDMPTFNTNPKLARQGEVMFFKELIKNLANEFGQQGVAEQQDDPYRTNTEQNMDSVAQFEVGQKVIFTSPLNNKKYEAVVKNIWPDTGSIEVFIPLGDQGGGLGTFASPKNLQPMQQEVAEGKKCNHTMEGTQCPVHGLLECPMQENKKLKETSAGSVAGVNNPPGKNSGKKKSQIGSLFGGTYKQTVHETDFAGEKTTPPQKPGDQVRGTEKPIKKGKQQPFYHRLVGNE